MRACGPCTACCTLTFVPELGKPENQTCKNCNGGCTIYAGRPNSCAEYECSWLKGHLPEHMRPDQCGVMIEEYPLMIAALLMPGKRIADLSRETIEVLDGFVAMGLPVIATGQFAKLPEGMSAQEAKDRMVKTIREVRAA